MISIVFTFYRTLDLDHLERAIYSLSRQTALDRATELVFIDNNTEYDTEEIRSIVYPYFQRPFVKYYFEKHGDPNKRHSWSANYGIRAAENDLIFFTRADYIVTEDAMERMMDEALKSLPALVSGWCWQMAVNRDGYLRGTVPIYEAYAWRTNVRYLLQHQDAHKFFETDLDAGTFVTTKQAIAKGGWFDETMINFGFQQSTLQRRMKGAGVRMKAIQDYLFFHQHHDADRDFDRARKEYINSKGG